MYHFQYVSKKEIAPLKKQLIELIGLVQDEIRDCFTFQYVFIGSVKRNMVTRDIKSNIGFDFDVNIMVHDDDQDYSAKEIKQILMKAFNKYVYPVTVFLIKYNFLIHNFHCTRTNIVHTLYLLCGIIVARTVSDYECAILFSRKKTE